MRQRNHTVLIAFLFMRSLFIRKCRTLRIAAFMGVRSGYLNLAGSALTVVIVITMHCLTVNIRCAGGTSAGLNGTGINIL